LYRSPGSRRRKTTSADLPESYLLLDVKQAIPEKQQEEPILPAEGTKSYEEELIKCQKFFSVSNNASSTYLIE
jgi:hypothetical protein